eukprot:Amastigsp_a679711_122.p3 type:complete len:132 gc:universal Amastigsp_a679711_122:548-943(+)
MTAGQCARRDACEHPACARACARAHFPRVHLATGCLGGLHRAASCCGTAGGGQKQLVVVGELGLAVEAIGEVDATDAAVCVNLDPERFDVVGAVGAARKVREIELDLVPALVELHGHRANERLDAGRGLVV